MHKIAFAAILLSIAGCNNRSRVKELALREQAYTDTLPHGTAHQRRYDFGPDKDTGSLISLVVFKTATNDLKKHKQGLIKGISLEYPEKTIDQVIGKDSIVITDEHVTFSIDYPLTIPQRNLHLSSRGGFTKKYLVEAISREYHKIYDAEKASEPTMTIPFTQQKSKDGVPPYGRYGIWGYKLGDLMLYDISVFRWKYDGGLYLTLNVGP